MRFAGRRIRGADALLDQVVVRPVFVRLLSLVVALLVAAPAAGQRPPLPPISLTVQPTVTALDPRDFADFLLATGEQVPRARVDQIFSDRDYRAAAAYFEARKLKPQMGGIVDTRFRRVSTKEAFEVSFVPFVEQQGPPGALQNVIMIVRNQKGVGQAITTRVSVGAIAVEKGRELKLREDHAVTDGRVVQGQGSLKGFIKCALPGCAAIAAGCFLTPGWIPCFCAACGTGAIVCAALEVFAP